MKPKTYCEKWPSGCQFCDLILCDGKKETAEERCVSYLKDRTDKEGEKDNA